MVTKTTQATINELLAGSVGGAAQVIVGQPLDTIKTRAQVAPSASFFLLSSPLRLYSSNLLFSSLVHSLVLLSSGCMTDAILECRGHVRKSPHTHLTLDLRRLRNDVERPNGHPQTDAPERRVLRSV